MKRCSKCGINKCLDDFYKRKTSRDGLRNRCKKCHDETVNLHRINNKDKHNQRCQNWRNKNKDKIKIISKKYREKNPNPPYNKEKKKLSNALWTKNNLDRHAANEAKRHAKKLQSTPNWLTVEQVKEIEQFYSEARKLTKKTGIKYEVDHIIPLQGLNVRGLHVPWNLQILTKSENSSKRNWIKK